MDVRYSTDPQGFQKMTTEELRKAYLIDNLFAPNKVPMTYSDIDRSITGSAMPVKVKLKLLASKKEMAAEKFCERREVGVINIGGDGAIAVDGKEFAMASKDVLYIGRGAKEVTFASKSSETPAKFYFVSYLAHKEYPTTHATLADAEHAYLGSQKDANKRTINRMIHANGIQSCQLVMGLTELEEGSVWNTMPSHTHQRRSEVYMYFNVDPDAVVVHLMGQPHETRHIIMRNGQAVLNPSWSIHSGGGTRNYSFIWAMGGENQVFDDMDGVTMDELK
ncbi:MAG: 5-dehydro-4-deoxy-D-glucuronate isomerase [Bacteroidota bacterium]|jgi:4-deoxy-L-threo-5-hexosulose-uronate ketol-isomerase